jgi:hypothetical protein
LRANAIQKLNRAEAGPPADHLEPPTDQEQPLAAHQPLLQQHHPGGLDFWINWLHQEITELEAEKVKANVWQGWEIPIGIGRLHLPTAEETARKKPARALVCRIDASGF